MRLVCGTGSAVCRLDHRKPNDAGRPGRISRHNDERPPKEPLSAMCQSHSRPWWCGEAKAFSLPDRMPSRTAMWRGWPYLRVPTASLGRWAFSEGGAGEKGRVFSWWFTRSSRHSRGAPRRQTAGDQAGRRAGGRAATGVRASVRASVRLSGCRQAERSDAAEVEFTALKLPLNSLRESIPGS